MNMLLVVFVAAVGLVIYICVRHAIRLSPLADNSFMISIAVTILCLLGLFQHVGPTQKEPKATEFGDVGLTGALLPYAALGISLLVVLLLFLLVRFFQPMSRRLSRRNERGSDCRLRDIDIHDEGVGRNRDPNVAGSAGGRVDKLRTSAICKRP